VRFRVRNPSLNWLRMIVKKKMKKRDKRRVKIKTSYTFTKRGSLMLTRGHL
jgi:hypothetical protein